MNARLYDPVIGRFFSPDPYVQAPESSQGFNRYSYCANNPLRYVDPSGELFDWFENQFTGAVFFNSHYGKNDAGKGNMLGDGWKWIGGNDKFGTVNNNFLNVFHEYYSSGGGYAFVWTSKSVDGSLSDSYEISFGSKSEAFMSKMGYKQVPMQVIEYEKYFPIKELMPGAGRISIEAGSKIQFTETIGYVPNDFLLSKSTQVGQGVYSEDEKESARRLNLTYSQNNAKTGAFFGGVTTFMKSSAGIHDWRDIGPCIPNMKLINQLRNRK